MRIIAAQCARTASGQPPIPASRFDGQGGELDGHLCAKSAEVPQLRRTADRQLTLEHDPPSVEDALHMVERDDEPIELAVVDGPEQTVQTAVGLGVAGVEVERSQPCDRGQVRREPVRAEYQKPGREQIS